MADVESLAEALFRAHAKLVGNPARNWLKISGTDRSTWRQISRVAMEHLGEKPPVAKPKAATATPGAKPAPRFGAWED